MIFQLIYGFLATVGFAVLFNLPKNAIIVSGISGTIGWAGYLIMMYFYPSTILSTFIAAVLIGIMGEIFARKFKNPSTIFVIPGLLPLVPGAYSYRTILAIIEGNNKQAITFGLQTIGVAIAIAAGLIIVISFARIKR